MQPRMKYKISLLYACSHNVHACVLFCMHVDHDVYGIAVTLFVGGHRDHLLHMTLVARLPRKYYIYNSRPDVSNDWILVDVQIMAREGIELC